MSTRSNLPPPGAPLVPVTVRRPWLNFAIALSLYAVPPLAFTWVTSNLIPAGPNVPSTNASVVASAHEVQYTPLTVAPRIENS